MAVTSSETRAPATGLRLDRLYEQCIIVYLVSLLFLYPYGIAAAAEANVRLPDAIAVGCLLLGSAAVLLRPSIRVDRTFVLAAGPFVFLEMIMPVVGAVGYQLWIDGVSAIRMAMLWLPMIILTMLASVLRADALERKLATVLRIALWLNVYYAVLQIAADFGYVPDSVLITRMLEPWAVDRHFEVVQGLRPAGFFVNTTALAGFGVISLSFFFARYVSRRRASDLRYSLLSTLVILLTTSRVGCLAAAMILVAGWLVLSPSRKAVLLVIIGAGVAALLVLVERTVGIEEAFYRFQRLIESGVLQDVSFGARVYRIWPAALESARDHTFGTLITAPRVIELVDSGYLNYYIQGKWVFLAAVVLLLSTQWRFGLQGLFQTRRTSQLMILNLAIYLTTAMVISNPLRNPLVIFFVVFSFWLLKCEKCKRQLHFLPTGTDRSQRAGHEQR